MIFRPKSDSCTSTGINVFSVVQTVGNGEVLKSITSLEELQGLPLTAVVFVESATVTSATLNKSTLRFSSKQFSFSNKRGTLRLRKTGSFWKSITQNWLEKMPKVFYQHYDF